MAKIGRPKSENPKVHYVSFRLTDEQYKLFDKYCKCCGKPSSDVMRSIIKVVTSGMEN